LDTALAVELFTDFDPLFVEFGVFVTVVVGGVCIGTVPPRDSIFFV
jgi:hypothetical protein